MGNRPAASSAVERDLTIVNQRGLHARAAAKFVKLADTFAAEISVTKGDMTVSGRSIMGLMMLAAGPGSVLTFSTEGSDPSEFQKEMSALFEKKFEES